MEIAYSQLLYSQDKDYEPVLKEEDAEEVQIYFRDLFRLSVMDEGSSLPIGVLAFFIASCPEAPLTPRQLSAMRSRFIDSLDLFPSANNFERLSSFLFRFHELVGAVIRGEAEKEVFLTYLEGHDFPKDFYSWCDHWLGVLRGA